MSFWIKVLAVLLNFLIWLPIVIVYLICWPFAFVYERLLCCFVWYRLRPESKFIVVIHENRKDAQGYLAKILDSAGQQVHVLDYSERQHWRRWSLPVRLFWSFGPNPMPPRFIPDFLPAVVLVRRFKRPQKFSFGSMSKEREAAWEELKAKL